jgi:hypothetical protein
MFMDTTVPLQHGVVASVAPVWEVVKMEGNVPFKSKVVSRKHSSVSSSLASSPLASACIAQSLQLYSATRAFSVRCSES